MEGGGLLHWGLWEECEILFYQKTLFIGDSGRYVKEGSRNGHLSLWGSVGETGGGGDSFTGDFEGKDSEKRIMEGSEKEVFIL